MMMNYLFPAFHFNRKSIYFLFFFHFSQIAFAENGFERVYGGYQDASFYIQNTRDDGFVIGGSNNSLGTSRPYILKINDEGDSLWSRYYYLPYFGSATGITELLTGQLGMIGTVPYNPNVNSAVASVQLLDSTGNISASYSFPEFNDAWSTSGVFLTSNRDSGFACIYYTDGYTADNYYRIKVVGRHYNWEHLSGGEGVGWPFSAGRNSISQNQNGDYFLFTDYGTAFNFNYTNACSIMKFSESGSVLLDSIYDWEITTESIYSTRDGGAIICGQVGNTSTKIYKIDSAGNLEWNRLYHNPVGNLSGVQALQTYDNNYAFLARSAPAGIDTSDIVLMKLDLYGDSLWTRKFGGQNSDNPAQFRETPDSGFVILGFTNSFGAKHIYVIKTDSMGFVNQRYFISSISNQYCIGDTAILSVQHSNSYLWSNGETTQSIHVTQTGSYQVIVMDSLGMSFGTGFFSVYFNPVPVTVLNLDTLSGICTGSELENTGTNYPGLTYEWYLNDTFLTLEHGFSLIPAVTGEYKLIISNNCGLDSDLTVIDTIFQLPPVPVVSPSYHQICPGDSALFTTPFDSVYNYQWMFIPNYYSPGIPIAAATDTSFYGMNAGNYQVAVSNINQCTNYSNPVSIWFFARPEISFPNFNDTLLCPRDSVELYVCCGTSYVWNTGNTTSFIWTETAGDYFVTALNGAGCPLSSDTFHLMMQSPSFISIGNDTIVCNDSSLVLRPDQSFDYYFWSDGSRMDTLLVSASGNYSLIAESDFGCPAFDTIQIRFGNSQYLSLGADTSICNSQSLLLNAGAGYAMYHWNDGSTNLSLTAFTLSHNLDSAFYAVTVTDSAGCSNTDSVFVRFLICTGIGSYNPEKDYTIYPNPVKQSLIVQIPQGFLDNQPVFILNDESGKEIRRIILSKEITEINCQNFPEGIYLYTIMRGNQIFTTGKLVQQ